MKKYLGILISLIAVFIVGIFCADTVKGWFDKPEDPTNEVEGGEQTDVVTNVQNSDMLKLAVSRAVSTDSTALTVNATLTPSYAVDDLTWTLAWASSNSAAVTDYITITPSTDTMSCTVNLKQAFTTQIILTCASKINASVKSTVTIDYVSRTVEYIGRTNFTIDEPMVDMMMEFFKSANFKISGGSLAPTSIAIGEIYHDIDPCNYNSACGVTDQRGIQEEEEYQKTLIDYYDPSVYYNCYENDCLYAEFASVVELYYNNTLIATINMPIVRYDIGLGNVNFNATNIEINDSKLVF